MAGIVFVIIGMLSITGIIPIAAIEDGMDDSQNEMNSMMMAEDSSQHKDSIDMNMNDNMNMSMKTSRLE